MTPRQGKRKGGEEPALPGPDDLPLLVGFFRGHLHEDFEAELVSPEGAARDWLRTLTEEERSAAAREATCLAAALAGVGISGIRSSLGTLGAAWWPEKRGEVVSLLDLLAGKSAAK
jgi:hypothetical protein